MSVCDNRLCYWVILGMFVENWILYYEIILLFILFNFNVVCDILRYLKCVKFVLFLK